MMNLQQTEYEALLGLAKIQPSDVLNLHLAWGQRTEKGRWIGVVLLELTRGRGPRGGKKGNNRFVLIEADAHYPSVQWNTHLDRGWGRIFELRDDRIVAAPDPPPPPPRLGGRRAAVAATKEKLQAREADAMGV